MQMFCFTPSAGALFWGKNAQALYAGKRGRGTERGILFGHL
jgi:hypothetical protein